MLSNLPKLADKAFVLGFFLPTLLFVLAAGGLFWDVPAIATLMKQTASADSFEKLVYLALIVWTLAALLLMANHSLVQVLEGYRWPLSKMTNLKERERQRFAPLYKRLAALRADWDAAGAAFPADKKREYGLLRIELVANFPTDPDFLLPTRFGNAIRAFEFYSKEVYGADSIPLWIHLATVIPKDFQDAIEDARAQVNCLVNLCFLAALMAVMAFARLVASLDWGGAVAARDNYPDLATLFEGARLRFAVVAIMAIMISRVAYRFSIEQVQGWGSLVKAAFDCYLPALATKLGYELPFTTTEQNSFWGAISRRAIFQRALKAENWRKAPKEMDT